MRALISVTVIGVPFTLMPSSYGFDPAPEYFIFAVLMFLMVFAIGLKKVAMITSTPLSMDSDIIAMRYSEAVSNRD